MQRTRRNVQRATSTALFIRRVSADMLRFPHVNIIHVTMHAQRATPCGMRNAKQATVDLNLTVASDAAASGRARGDDIQYTARLQFSERLNADGSIGTRLNVGDIIYTTTAAKLAETNGVVQFSPSFTYGGFQYCQINLTVTTLPPVPSSLMSGAPPAPSTAAGFVATASSITAHFTHADVPVIGHVGFSNPLINTIQKMVHYTSLSNLQDVPTDCPTRERAGWTGDGQLTSDVTSFNFDMAAYYTKWLRDIGDAQDSYEAQCKAGGEGSCDCFAYNCTGEIPPAAPFYNHGYHGGSSRRNPGASYPGTDPAWGMAFTVMSHKMLAFFGDLDAVRRQYSRLQLYIEYLAQIPGVDPVVAPFKESGLLTYNVYSDWDRAGGG